MLAPSNQFPVTIQIAYQPNEKINFDFRLVLGEYGGEYRDGYFTMDDHLVVEELRCPKDGCTYRTKSINDISTHYHLHYNKGYSIAHKCCRKSMDDFLEYCFDVFLNYAHLKGVRVHFIHPIYDRSYRTHGVDIQTVLLTLISKVNDYGSYFIFSWNSEELAKRFLIDGDPDLPAEISFGNIHIEKDLVQIQEVSNDDKNLRQNGCMEPPVFNDGISFDNLEKYRRDLFETLSRNRLPPTEEYEMELGLKKWSFTQGSHRAVIVKVKDENLAFRLEFIFEQNSQINVPATFSCSSQECDFKTESFRKFTSHYLNEHYRKGDLITHQCCGLYFHEFVLFCKHLYENHNQQNVTGIQFERIGEEKMKEFLNEDSVSFYSSSVKVRTFENIITTSLSILKNFGRYFTFFWNCQDFATWFLVLHGISLDEIEPTLTDRSSGSETESNIRCIRNFKKRWYITDEEREDETDRALNDFLVGYKCNYHTCQYLPYMSIEDLSLHEELVHKDNKIESSHEICRKLVGQNFDPLTIYDRRRFSLYQLRRPHLTAHDSIVLQPWTDEIIPQKLNHFCRLHVVKEKTEQIIESAFKIDVISYNGSNLHYVYDFEIELNALYARCLINRTSEIGYSTLTSTSNCGTICDELKSFITLYGNVLDQSKSIKNDLHFRCSLLLQFMLSVYHSIDNAAPLVFLTARTFSSTANVVRYWVILRCFITVFGSGALRLNFVRLRDTWNDGLTSRAININNLISILGLLILSIYVLMDLGNLFPSFILYETWMFLLRMNNLINAFVVSYLGKVSYEYEPIESILLTILHTEYTVLFLLHISYTFSYLSYVATQIFIVAYVLNLKRMRPHRNVEFMNRSKYQMLLVFLMLSIAVYGLIFRNKEIVVVQFKDFNYLYLLPYLFGSLYVLVGMHSLIEKVQKGSEVERNMRHIKEFLGEYGLTAHENRDVKRTLDLICMLEKVIQHLNHLLIPLMVSAYILLSIKTQIVIVIGCFFIVSYTCKLYTMLAFSIHPSALLFE